MHRYIIERQIPSIGSADAAALQVAAERSNSAFCRLAPRIHRSSPMLPVIEHDVFT
jgi:hypothetical protein